MSNLDDLECIRIQKFLSNTALAQQVLADVHFVPTVSYMGGNTAPPTLVMMSSSVMSSPKSYSVRAVATELVMLGKRKRLISGYVEKGG